MLEINFTKEIPVPIEKVWKVIVDTHNYKEWNNFVLTCTSTFEVGSPIKMKVRLLPFLTISQKETIFQFEEHKIIEYGIKLPFGLLLSSRKHILFAKEKNLTVYESKFLLKGLLAPVVKFLLAKQLYQGFESMTNGVHKFTVR